MGSLAETCPENALLPPITPSTAYPSALSAGTRRDSDRVSGNAVLLEVDVSRRIVLTNSGSFKLTVEV